MSSSSSSSSSSAALATVVVTARDIEFSNYNSVTGKWGGAVMTMMILDAVTEELEGYNERVYAVFRNHDDPTDLIRFSSEVDGLDTRVTTTDPMVASAKYELYKIYGATSGGEYATTSEFYFQVPGKEWDFANDTVTHDVTLVSDWFNYGYVKDTNDVIHGIANFNEIAGAVTLTNDTDTFTINGVSMTRPQVKGFKYTSLVNQDVYGKRFLYRYENLEELDVVSARIERLITPSDANAVRADGSLNASVLDMGNITGSKFNCRFAFPETLKVFVLAGNSAPQFNQPIYMPNSVIQSWYGLYGAGLGNATAPNYNKKIRFSPNMKYHAYMNFYNLTSWNRDIYPLSTNVQLQDGYSEKSFMYQSGFNKPYAIPSVWTYIPKYFMSKWTQWNQDLVIPNNITSIHNGAVKNLPKCKSITFTSGLTSMQGNSCCYLGSSGYLTKIKNLQNARMTSTPANFLAYSYLDLSEFGFPQTVTSLGQYFMTSSLQNSCTTLPTDQDGYHLFDLPEGITTLGQGVFSNIWIDSSAIEKIKFTLPSTISSIAEGFCRDMAGLTYNDYIQNPVTVIRADFTKISPNVFPANDQRSFCVTSETYLMPVEIEIAQGTTASWQAKLPDIAGNTAGHYVRKIIWVEHITAPQYGEIVYYPNYTTTWGISGYAGVYSGSEPSIYDVNSFTQWLGSLSPAPKVEANGDITFYVDQNGHDMSYQDASNNWTTIQYGVYSMDGVSINFSYDPGEKYVKFNQNATVDSVSRTPGTEVTVQLTSAQYDGLAHTKACSDIDYVTRVTAGPGNTEIPIACIKKFTFGTNSTYITNYFLSGSSVEEIDMQYVSSIDMNHTGFLSGCTMFNSPVDLSKNSANSIGTYFLYHCSSFDQALDTSGLDKIPSYFLTDGSVFNHALDLSSVTQIGHDFLTNARLFNKSLDVRRVTSVGDHFLTGCYVFNKALNFSSLVTCDRFFMSNCQAFNQTLNITNLTTTKESFMNYCYVFNQPIDTSSLVRTGRDFMASCYAFNQTLNLNNLEYACETTTGNSRYAQGFLINCKAYNKPISLPKVKAIGGFENMEAFNSTITFGPYLEYLEMWSFSKNDIMVSEVNFGSNNANNVRIGSTNYWNSLFQANSTSVPAFTQGVPIGGSQRSTWLTKLSGTGVNGTRKVYNAGH